MASRDTINPRRSARKRSRAWLALGFLVFIRSGRHIFRMLYITNNIDIKNYGVVKRNEFQYFLERQLSSVLAEEMKSPNKALKIDSDKSGSI